MKTSPARATSANARPIRDYAELETRMRSGELQLVLEIPPGFARDVKRDRSPAIGAWIDGAMPFRAETVRGYVEGLHESWLAALRAPERPARRGTTRHHRSALPLQPGFQEHLCHGALDDRASAGLYPGGSHGCGRRRRKGAAARHQFLCHARDAARISARQTTSLRWHRSPQFFHHARDGALPIPACRSRASFLALAAGAVLYVWATTGLGLVMSSFTKTQLAAIFGTAIATMMPATQFSGMMTPVSSLAGGAQLMGAFFPTTYFMKIAVGTFTKALGFADLVPEFSPSPPSSPRSPF